MKIRLTLGPGDSYDFEVKPFNRLTTADYIRIFEPAAEDEYWPVWPDEPKEKGMIKRYSGAPDRFIRFLTPAEVKTIAEMIADANKENDRLANSLRKVQDTLDNWAKEHDGKDWTVDDAIYVLEGHGLYRQEITVNGRTYRAVNIEESATFAQWIDLQADMDNDGNMEAGSYVQALAIMMDGEDGKYPEQSDDEPDAEFERRTIAWTTQRRSDFMAAPFIEVMGIAAFFFSKSERFATICAHSMSSLQELLPLPIDPERRIIPNDDGLTQN